MQRGRFARLTESARAHAAEAGSRPWRAGGGRRVWLGLGVALVGLGTALAFRSLSTGRPGPGASGADSLPVVTVRTLGTPVKPGLGGGVAGGHRPARAAQGTGAVSQSRTDRWRAARHSTRGGRRARESRATLRLASSLPGPYPTTRNSSRYARRRVYRTTRSWLSRQARVPSVGGTAGFYYGSGYDIYTMKVGR